MPVHAREHFNGIKVSTGVSTRPGWALTDVNLNVSNVCVRSVLISSLRRNVKNSQSAMVLLNLVTRNFQRLLDLSSWRKMQAMAKTALFHSKFHQSAHSLRQTAFQLSSLKQRRTKLLAQRWNWRASSLISFRSRHPCLNQRLKTMCWYF